MACGAGGRVSMARESCLWASPLGAADRCSMDFRERPFAPISRPLIVDSSGSANLHQALPLNLVVSATAERIRACLQLLRARA